jgi:hypothetical protein
MNESFIAGLAGVLGILVGAVLQFWLTRRIEREAKYMELKLSAYVDYINSIARVAFLNPSERSKALDQVVAAKTRICIFGDKEVLEAVAGFERTSKKLVNADAQHAFTNLCQVMREHGIAGGSVADETLNALLFGLEHEN